eukprot:scaffold576_cov260-Pinguiococcus_pyrenoidosus.AAC.14
MASTTHRDKARISRSKLTTCGSSRWSRVSVNRNKSDTNRSRHRSLRRISLSASDGVSLCRGRVGVLKSAVLIRSHRNGCSVRRVRQRRSWPDVRSEPRRSRFFEAVDLPSGRQLRK